MHTFNTIIGRRFSVTGVFGYEFIDDAGETVSVSSVVVPSAPVMIYGYGRQWKSDYDQKSTIIPGRTRRVVDQKTQCVVGVIKYIDDGIYTINDGVTVRCYEKEYRFYAGETEDRLIAVLGKGSVRGAVGGIPIDDGNDEHSNLDIYVSCIAEDIPYDTVLLILSFPMLRFAF